MVYKCHLKRHVRRGVVILAMLGVGVSTAVNGAEAQIAVAANFSVPMRRLVQQFSAQSPHTIRIVTGSTGKLYSQIFHGAPFHAFLAADQVTPARLVKDDLAIPTSTFTYANGRLIFWRRNPTGIGDTAERTAPWDAIKRRAFPYIAIANPKLAPFGRAAVQAMQRAGVYAAAEKSLVYGESVTQAHQFVATGAADAGFISLSQVWQNGQLATGQGWLVPAHWHAPIRQDAVLLKRGAQNEAAQAFMVFLKSAQAKQTLAQFGYIE